MTLDQQLEIRSITNKIERLVDFIDDLKSTEPKDIFGTRFSMWIRNYNKRTAKLHLLEKKLEALMAEIA